MAYDEKMAGASLVTYAEMSEALAIFMKYPDNEAGFTTDDYGIYAGPHPDIVSEEDVMKLAGLEWNISETHECFYYFT